MLGNDGATQDHFSNKLPEFKVKMGFRNTPYRNLSSIWEELVEVLDAWKNRESENASLKKLTEVLRDCGLNLPADRLCKAFKIIDNGCVKSDILPTNDYCCNKQQPSALTVNPSNVTVPSPKGTTRKIPSQINQCI